MTLDRVRLLLIDPDSAARERTRSLFEADARFEVLSSLPWTLDFARFADVRLIVLDPFREGAFDSTAVAAIEETLAESRLLVFTEHFQANDFRYVLTHGASAYLLKSTTPPDGLLECAYYVVRFDGLVLGADLAALLRGPPAAAPPAPGLSERESDVLRLLAIGKTDKEIAAALGVSISTVHSHVGSLLRRLGVRTRVELGLKAAQMSYAARDGTSRP